MYYGTVKDRYTNQPIKNIPVSDGLNVVLTDENGSFSLAGWERARLIYVCMLTKAHDDWYLLIDENTKRYDLSVSPADVSDPCFSYLHISDTEILNENERTDWVSFARETVNAHSPAFFVQTGDIAREFGLKKHREVMNYNTVGCPVRYTIGNHDFTNREYGEGLYEELYGPTWYSFDCGSIHFVILSIAGLERTEFPTGYQPDDQWKWLENDLDTCDPSRRVIVLCHTYCYPDPFGFCPEINGKSYDLKKRGLLAWAFGHTHVNYLHNIEGVFYINSSRPDSGGVDSSEGAIRKTTLNGDKLTSEMIYCSPYKLEKDSFVWEKKLPGRVNFCTPVVLHDSIVVGTVDDGYPKDCGIFRISKSTGDIIWGYPTDNSITGALAYDNGKIYAQDNSGLVYCINAESGKTLWTNRLQLTKNSYTRSGVLIAEGYVIAGNPKNTFALDKETGKQIWCYKFRKGEDSPVRSIYDKKNRQILLSANWYALLALDIDSGEVKWKCDDVYIWFRTSTPLLLDDRIYVAARGHIMELDARSGEIIRSVAREGIKFEVSSPPVYADGMLYVPTATSGVIAVNVNDFEIIRKFSAGQANLFTSPYLGGKVETVESTPIINGDKLIFSSLDGCVRYYDRHTGALLHNVKVGSPVLQAPIFTDDGIITVDFDGYITKFKN